MHFSFTSKSHLLEAIKITGASDETMDELASQMNELTVRSNHLLVKPGQVNTHLYYVLSGGFACRYVSEDLEIERTINFYLNELHPLMACIDSYFAQTKTLCELRALGDSTVLAIPKVSLDALLTRDPQLKLLFDSLLVMALIEENDLKLKIIAYKPDTLYQYLLKEFPVIIQKVPSRYIAELMGISAEWLSKLKSRQKYLS